MKHANERNGSVVAELASLPAGFSLNASMHDTESSEISALQALSSALAMGFGDAVLGAGYSSVSKSLAHATTISQIPQLSYWSSSPELSSAAYTHFSRVWVSDASTATMLVSVLASQGWEKIGVVFVNTNYAQSYVRMLRSAAQHHGSIQVHAAASYEYEDRDDSSKPTSARSAVQTVLGAGVNVIVAVVYDLGPVLQAPPTPAPTLTLTLPLSLALTLTLSSRPCSPGGR